MKSRSFTAFSLTAVILTGCSVYHQARNSLPPDRQERIALRLTDARKVESEATKAVSAWNSEGSVHTSTRVDRLDMLGRELERRVLAVEDAAAQMSLAETDSRELQRLRGRVEAIRNIVRDARAGNDSSVHHGIESFLSPG